MTIAARRAHLSILIVNIFIFQFTIKKHRGCKTLYCRHSVYLRMYRRLVELLMRPNHIAAVRTLYHFAMVGTSGRLRFVVHRLPYY